MGIHKALVLTILFGLLNGCFGPESLAFEDDLLTRIDKYKAENGHPPKCQNSRELIDTLWMNGNEYYPEYFDYKYYADSNYYILKVILHHESNNLIIDSREMDKQK